LNPEILALLERYNAAIAKMEDEAIARLNTAIDQSYRNLERELRAKYPAIAENGSLTAMQQKVLIANDLNELLQLIKPGQQQEYQQLMTNLLQLASNTGATLADQLMRAIAPDSPIRQFTGIPLDAVALQAENGLKRLYRHSDEFASRASAIVEQGLIQQWGARRVGDVIRSQLETTKFSAERIARTEVLSSLNDAAQQRYKENGVDGVTLIPIADDRTCKLCVARAGLVYAVGTVRVPLHPLCRCMVVPQSSKWRELGLIDEDFISEFRVGAIAGLKGEPDNGVSPFEKMAGVTTPPQPIWKPKETQTSPKPQTQPIPVAKPAESGTRSNTPTPATPTPATPEQTPLQVLQMEDRLRVQRFESVAVFDRQGNQVFFKNGEEFQVELTDGDVSQMRGMIGTHNHPRGWGFPAENPRSSGNSFSPEDWDLAASAEMAEFRAVSPGYRFSIRPPEGGWNAQYAKRVLMPAIEIVQNEVRAENMRLINEVVRSGDRAAIQRAIDEAESDHYHQVATKLSQRLGIPYSREPYQQVDL
jgi:SPP1 gp7 family putative phage head morphogenesis protein